MITIYFDHNVIDMFDRGEMDYLFPLLKNNDIVPIISMYSVDEVFRGGDEIRSRRNIESLKTLGARYIHSGPDKFHLQFDELDYDNIHTEWKQKWVTMQFEIGSFNHVHYNFMSAIYCGNTPEAIQKMDWAITNKIDWLINNADKYSNPNELALNDQLRYKELCTQLLKIKEILPFNSKIINNESEEHVFWDCIQTLKNNTNLDSKLIGDFIENSVLTAHAIEDQFISVFFWLNFFGYHSDNLRRIDKARSNFSDSNHGTYALACNGLFTLDKKFAKRSSAAMRALKLKTQVNTNVNDLIIKIITINVGTD